jgi:short-subunit dehydrogenase
MPSIRLKPLAEQVIVITGASSGIGLVTARQAAARGAKVVLVARNGETLERIAREIVAAGCTAIAAAADVGKLDEIETAARRAIGAFGRIDTWVNDAGVAIYGRLLDTPDDEHRQLFQTNYFGVVHGCCVAVPHLKESGGALITLDRSPRTCRRRRSALMLRRNTRSRPMSRRSGWSFTPMASRSR